MDFETVGADAFGASLKGLGLNLLVPDVAREIAFLTETFGMTAHRVSADFAIISTGETLFQLHSDATYAQNPYQGFLPETPPRGAGAELRLAWAGDAPPAAPLALPLDGGARGGGSAGGAGLLAHVALRGEAVAGGDADSMQAPGGVREPT